MRVFREVLSIQKIFRGQEQNSTVILLLSPLLIVTWRYFCSPLYYSTHIALHDQSHATTLFAATYSFLTAFLMFGLIPVLIISLLFRESLKEYGFQVGDWKYGILTVGVLVPLFIVLSYFSAQNPEFVKEYPINRSACTCSTAFLLHSFLYLLYYIGYEILMRGFIQCGLRKYFGDWNAILVQTVISTLFHIGKPTGEIYASILGGIIWGWIVFRSRSLLYVLLMHWILGISLDFFICLGR
ncbi:MAG: CPBP family intramembrane metalloprotease [Bacteroidetes bacterium]|nr:CPBP family intramembrane metalloprotease [Bacteroidota bacterium]